MEAEYSHRTRELLGVAPSAFAFLRRELRTCVILEKLSFPSGLGSHLILCAYAKVETLRILDVRRVRERAPCNLRS